MTTSIPDRGEVYGPPQLHYPPEKVIDVLSPLITTQRLHRIEEVVTQRTDDLVVVLDQVSDPHNVSAILRSADAFGLQTLHVITDGNEFAISKGVSKGSQHWMDICSHTSTEACITTLQASGFKVFVASMESSRSPESLSQIDRLAIVFGNEHKGVSQGARTCADGTFAIEMHGFVESLNVSVAAAITIRTLRQHMDTPICSVRQLELKARFLMNSVRNAEHLIKEAEAHGPR